jgi:hypothetical protein
MANPLEHAEHISHAGHGGHGEHGGGHGGQGHDEHGKLGTYIGITMAVLGVVLAFGCGSGTEAHDRAVPARAASIETTLCNVVTSAR